MTTPASATVSGWTGRTWPHRFDGASVVVFGGASGIGAATANRLRAEGATVLVADRQRPTVPSPDRWIECDLRNEDAAQFTLSLAIEQVGAVDLVVNAVGTVLDASVTETSEADWRRLLDINLTAAYRVTRFALAVLPHHVDASITHVASDAGIVGWPRQAAYCAAKGGLVHFVKAAALDAAPAGIRINCVCPSFTATPLVEAWIAAAEDPATVRAEIEATQPLGRIAQPQEIAAGIAWLASGEASRVTGIALPIDGGVVAQ